MKVRPLIVIAVIIFSVVIALATYVYFEVFTPKNWCGEDPDNPSSVYVPSDSDYPELLKTIQETCPEIPMGQFRFFGKQMNLPNNIHGGHYEIPDEISLIELIRLFRSGLQTPVQVAIPPAWNTANLIPVIARQLELDSTKLTQAFFTDDSVALQMHEILPNNYEMYWNVSPRALLNRMKKESEAFWNSKRRKLAADSLGLTPKQVYTLASIVYRETKDPTEIQRIAGVYMNRLERGIALQADPTVIYALQDFSIRRVLNRHLEFDSPYNTYEYPGLPPGPISITPTNYIDGVLNYEKHNYLYFCADPERPGSHSFASNYREHMRNARAYHQHMNR